MSRMTDLPRPDRTVGVFETLLILEGTPIELERHLSRLNDSARELFGASLPAGTRELVVEQASASQVGRLRLTVAPREDGSLSTTAIAALVDADDVFPSWERAIALCPLVVPGGLGRHKWADREGLARVEGGQAEGCVPLVLDAGEEVLEASRANVFACEDGTLLTPAADGRILPGVARARAIEIAGSLGLEVREERISVARMVEAGSAFLTGSVRGVELVRSVDGAKLRAPGDAVAELAREMRRTWMAMGAP
jgi:para-aminobenzoate synthetase/4-amino-4-deoxychorismate lyase